MTKVHKKKKAVIVVVRNGRDVGFVGIRPRLKLVARRSSRKQTRPRTESGEVSEADSTATVSKAPFAGHGHPHAVGVL